MSDNIKYIYENEAMPYSDYLLANHCMPTLLKLKPSNVFCISKKFIADRVHFFHQLKSEITQFDCNYLLLYEDTAVYFIMVYNEELLSDVLRSSDNEGVLTYYGYQVQALNVMEQLRQLQQRYHSYRSQGSEFPHEMGIFLGYPKRDVEEYIRNHGANYIFCGVWKVYHDAEHAMKLFDSFHQVRKEAIDCLLNGKKLIDLKQAYTKTEKQQSI